MKLIAIDNDRDALVQTKDSLQAVYKTSEIEAFTNPLLAVQYCVAHKDEIEQVFTALVMKPIDGFELADTLKNHAMHSSIEFVTQTASPELLSLVQSHYGCHTLVKPVTPERLWAMARKTQRGCLDCFDEDDGDSSQCVECIYHWCERWRPAH